MGPLGGGDVNNDLAGVFERVVSDVAGIDFEVVAVAEADVDESGQVEQVGGVVVPMGVGDTGDAGVDDATAVGLTVDVGVVGDGELATEIFATVCVEAKFGFVINGRAVGTIMNADAEGLGLQKGHNIIPF